MPPLLAVVVFTAGNFIEPSDVRGRIRNEVRSVVGVEGANQVTTMLEKIEYVSGKGWRALVGVSVLLVGASGVMSQLQSSLNAVWRVKPRRRRAAPGSG